MGLTLIAILTAALLLPGILSAWFFFRAASTSEIEAPVPSLSTPEGIALVGAFSVIVHFVYSLILQIVSMLPSTQLPLANPYALFAMHPDGHPLQAAYELFSGLLCLCATAILIGNVTGRLMMRRADKSFFYGPLSDLLTSGHGDDAFITAYVISRIEEGRRVLGYQGVIVSLFRDVDRFPSKVVLRDAVPFYIELEEERPRRVEGTQIIDWLVLTADEWHNIAFRVYRLEDSGTATAA